MQNDGSTSQFTQFMRQRWVRVFLVIDVLILLFVIGFAIFNDTKSATVIFNVAPIDAKIQLSGQGEYSNGTYKVHPGTYEITIARDGLDSKTLTLELNPSYVTNVTTFLSKDGSLAFYEMRENFESYQKLSEIASASDNQTTDQDTSAESFIAKFNAAYQLYLQQLPINYTTYKVNPNSRSGQSLDKDITIEASTECKKTLCIEALMLLTDDKGLVKTLLNKEGMDIEDYEVIYTLY